MVSSTSPWITIESAGTASEGKRPTATPTSTTRCGLVRCATCVCTAAPKEKPASTSGRSPRSFPACCDDAQQVFGLAAAFVVLALGGADAAEVRPQRDVAQLDESPARASARPCCRACRRRGDADGRPAPRRAALSCGRSTAVSILPAPPSMKMRSPARLICAGARPPGRP